MADCFLSSNEAFRAYINSNYLPNATSKELDTVLIDYPQDPTQGSPFDTGNQNALTPQYKRLAAFQGDLVFLAPRRFFLKHRSSKQPTWSYCENFWSKSSLLSTILTFRLP